MQEHCREGHHPYPGTHSPRPYGQSPLHPPPFQLCPTNPCHEGSRRTNGTSCRLPESPMRKRRRARAVVSLDGVLVGGRRPAGGGGGSREREGGEGLAVYPRVREEGRRVQAGREKRNAAVFGLPAGGEWALGAAPLLLGGDCEWASAGRRVGSYGMEAAVLLFGLPPGKRKEWRVAGVWVYLACHCGGVFRGG